MLGKGSDFNFKKKAERGLLKNWFLLAACSHSIFECSFTQKENFPVNRKLALQVERILISLFACCADFLLAGNS